MKLLVLIGISCLLVCGCNDTIKNSVDKEPELKTEAYEITTLENGEPSHVTVQHILIAFDGSLQGQPISRSKEEAEQFANEILELANAGNDFDELVKKHTDDEAPGIYQLANIDQYTDMRWKDRSKWINPRTGMVPAFGDVGFKLKVGEIGMAEYKRGKSPYGWHIIKRIK